uniref:Cationic amino acid transporter C-terminal domain-containing protein n=1 Tax=Strigamia maritima TaxID=126957 RepID=T1IVD4_STRMM
MSIPNINNPEMRRRAVLMVGKLIRTKNAQTLEASSAGKGKLKKCLTTLDLTSLGVGSCVGTGMYLVAGMVAHKFAGPGVVLSFMIAAIASIFSGVCYAEFGVRVPHTSGSAYMYSYVTVGEFLAFVIGWNMVLEYLIGTSACACALSACFDSLSNRAISDTFASGLGTMFGGPPDVLAFCICILMTILMVAGVKKSLVFNNVLNAVNLSVWAFIMGAGLFYADSTNWSEHKGFMPFGWSGVLTGAATCFYAFIGFDIIATTGEEAHNPKRDIPLAIIVSLGIILLAYVTSSMMLTLIVPFDKIDPSSALVEMFAYRGSINAKYIVSVGALAGLTVSMFGSMFPMPRVVYAMAKDGLIFKVLARIWPLTETPALATCVFGFAAAIASLLIKLEILVEMMSIGTLLAYTLVSTCVLILRYQPERTTLAEMLPDSFKQLEEEYGVSHARQPSPSPYEPHHVTWDDTENTRTYDDQATLIDNTKAPKLGSMDKGYGSVQEETEPAPPKGPGPLDGVFKRLEILCPRVFPWRDRNPATDESGQLVLKLVGILYLCIIIMDIIVVCEISELEEGSPAAIFFIFFFLFIIVIILLYISRKPQNRKTLKFMTPGLPFIPAIAITVNIYLIFKLSILSLVRFTVWMTIGLFVYFYYGIKNSTLEAEFEQPMEMRPHEDIPNDVSMDTKTDPQDIYIQQQPQYQQQVSTQQQASSVSNPNAYWDPIQQAESAWD